MVNQSIDDSGMQKIKEKIFHVHSQSVSQCALMNGHSMLKSPFIYSLNKKKMIQFNPSIRLSVCNKWWEAAGSIYFVYIGNRTQIVCLSMFNIHI